MAGSRARDGHTSDSRATSAIVCVCTTRLPLKMQARPATSGLKDAPSRELYGVQAAEACGCGSQPHAFGATAFTRGEDFQGNCSRYVLDPSKGVVLGMAASLLHDWVRSG